MSKATTIEQDGQVTPTSGVSKVFGTKRTCTIIGAPISLGQGMIGVELGPKVMRQLGIKDRLQEMAWPVTHDCNIQVESANNASITGTRGASKVQHAQAVGDACKQIYDRVKLARKDGNKDNFVLTIGGDHTISIGTVSALREANPSMCVVWISAFADMHTPDTSKTGFMHGMVGGALLKSFDASALPGFSFMKEYAGLDNDSIAMIGVRDLDAVEKQQLKAKNTHVFSMHHIDKYGIAKVLDLALDAINPGRDKEIHVIFDMSAIDPLVAPGTGTKVLGGLTYRESRFVLEEIAKTKLLRSMDISEINPTISPQMLRCATGSYEGAPVNTTVAMGMELILSALGRDLL